MKISYYLARRILFTAFVSISLIALGAAISAVSALDKYGMLIKNIEALHLNHVAVKADTESFWVREHEGVVGVFDEDGNLQYTVEVYIKTLPEKDRLLLRDGIFACDKNELLEILGDYNS